MEVPFPRLLTRLIICSRIIPTKYSASCWVRSVAVELFAALVLVPVRPEAFPLAPNVPEVPVLLLTVRLV